MIKSLASLRFVFAFLVFLHHIDLLEDAIGHAFFFLLSGYILTYVYQERFKKGTIRLSNFLKLRFSRLYPLYLATLIFAIPLSLHVLREDINMGLLQALSTVLMVQSFIPDASFYFALNGVAWSISDLFFFYILFPVLLGLIRKIELKYLFLIFGILAIFLMGCMYLTPSKWHHYIFYINPFFRVMDFSIGIALCCVLHNKGWAKYTNNATAKEIAALFILLGFYICAPYFPRVIRYSVYYWLPMVFFVGVFALQKGYISKVLSHPVLLKLGNLSFGFYLYHQLILRYCIRLNNKFHWISLDWVTYSISFIITLLVCQLSYSLFELPLKKIIRKKWSISLAKS